MVLESPDNVRPLRRRDARVAEPELLREGEDVGERRRSGGKDAGQPAETAAITDYELAFAGLYRRAYDVAYKLLGYRTEAEDAAQEALARAYLHWPSIHAYAEPWVVRVAANQAIGSWRKNRRLTHMSEADGDDVSGHSFTHDVDPSAHMELRKALRGLSKRQREVVVLRHIGGFSEKETAAVIGITTGAVKQHATRGLSALRTELSTGDGDV